MPSPPHRIYHSGPKPPHLQYINPPDPARPFRTKNHQIALCFFYPLYTFRLLTLSGSDVITPAIVAEMMEAIGGISFPVVFCDGESESEIGDVVIYPAMEFKRFQAVLSQKIGISPNQFSVFISSPESGRRIPVTSKINFSVISRETNCFFLVVLKRTKRERRRRNNQHHHLDESQYYNTPSSYYSPNKIKENPLENAVFLRRGAGINHHGGEAAALSGLGMPFAGRVEWENRVRELQIEKERYLMNMGLASASGFGLGQGGGGDGGGGGVVVCEECSRADELGTEVGFHWCAYDPVVTFRFRSPAGPISRPTTR